jgi:hypothetical protein
MKAIRSAAILAALGALAVAAAVARADTVVYAYPALPGPVVNCAWFDDNLDDRSIDALIRQTDLLYNRAPLPPGATVTMTGTGTTVRSEALVGFNLNGRALCSDAFAFTTQPEPSATP